MSQPRVIFSTAEPYFHAAQQELRAAFEVACIERLGPEVGCLEVGDLDVAAVAETCRRRPVVFVRHLMREVARIPFDSTSDDPDAVVTKVLGHFDFIPTKDNPALQVWVSGRAPGELRADDLRKRVADGLSLQGRFVARAGREDVLSVCVTPATTVLGCNRSADALADWPGGRVRLARNDQQVSRAELKLDELVKVFDLALPATGTALDLGASPGGWTRITRQRGFTVWAVDPGDLDPRVASDPGVHHARTTAGPFLAATDRTFDLIFNDMRMTPARSCTVMLDAAKRLSAGGLAVLTLKITPRDAFRTVRESLRTLERAYEIVHARQLYHNRNEVTVVARRRSPDSNVLQADRERGITKLTADS
ncbi:MAG: SAM-dependent methyltransferase [Thermomicrobiales bacterium]